MLINDMVQIFNQHREIILFLVNGYVLMSPYHDGMDSEATGSTLVFQCMLQLTENPKVVVKSKIVHVGRVG